MNIKETLMSNLRQNFISIAHASSIYAKLIEAHPEISECLERDGQDDYDSIAMATLNVEIKKIAVDYLMEKSPSHFAIEIFSYVK